MQTISRHYFGGDSSEESQSFYIDIIENMQEDYGMFVWPCSTVLAEYVWQQRLRFSSKVVVELGAGTSLPGLVAAKVGAEVILTDNSHRTEKTLRSLRNEFCAKLMVSSTPLRENGAGEHEKICNLNGIDCNIGPYLGEWDVAVFSLQPHIILGADVLYDSSDFDNLFATVTFLLRNCPGSVFITTYHNRSGHHLIEFLMVKWGLKCSKLLDGFSFMPSNKLSSLQGNIQLVEITTNTIN